MQGHQPHPATPISDAAFLIKRGKKRGNYNCGRCGLPKKGHKCPFTTDNDDVSTTPVSTPAAAAGDSSTVTTLSSASAVAAGKVADTSPPSVVRPMMPASRRRALSFDDLSVADSIDELEEERFDLEEDLDLDGSGNLPVSCLWEVLRRLPPAELLSAARVCRGWRETTRKLWRAAEELRLRVPAKAQIGFVGSVLQKCPCLLRLSLRIESDVDATMLACIAFSCPNLQSLEIFTSNSSINRISGDELSRFIAEKRCLTSLKMEGCYNLGGFIFSSTSLSTLWLSDLHSLSKMVFNCPNLKEISLDFSRQENDSTDITTVVDALGRSCPKLQNIHIASFLLSHEAVLALSAANLRSSVSDSGIGMICNVLPETLSKLLLALCPNITSKRLLLQCGNLESVHASDCEDMLVKTIETQVYGDFAAVENHFPSKRLPDGSKRVRIPYFCSPQFLAFPKLLLHQGSSILHAIASLCRLWSLSKKNLPSSSAIS
ncbi:hypothetical protein DH2020_024643 [Rehmannia glutinosa]|uniref:F-box domain-containing protein n=1 Tax=Rehmannia glutinosa TaxID=99300 RepID=A0ABR0W1S9_REHGL